MSYETSPSRVNHRAALYKSGRSPNWRESLKAKCREEMQLRRRSMLNRMRNLSVDVMGEEEENESSILDTIMYSQFTALQRQMGFYPDFDEEEQQEYLQNVFEEIKLQLLSEQASEDTGDTFFGDLVEAQFEDPVICPLCQKHNLIKPDPWTISCECGMSIFNDSREVDLSQVRHALETGSNLHSNSCTSPPLFSLEAGEAYSELSMQCGNCSFFYRVL